MNQFLRRMEVQNLDPDDIVAVEVYRYPGEIPPGLRNWSDREVRREREGAGGAFPASRSTTEYEIDACGLALYWTGRAW